MNLPQHSTHSSSKSVDIERLLHVLDDAVYLQTGKHFSTLQTIVIRGVWSKQSYQHIAQSARCSETHIKRVGADLWEILSSVLMESVNKKTLRAILERRSSELLKRFPQATPPILDLPDIEENALELPDGPVRLTSRFYVNHPEIEVKCYQAIQQPGGLLRIIAPSKMGKTSLLSRVLFQVKQQGYPCVAIDLQLADRTILQNLDRFLRWFCVNTAHGLQLPSQLDEYWNTTFGSKVSCQNYFKDFLLPQLEVPLILALDELDLLLAYPHIADDFFTLLRSWYEQAKDSELWQKLRLILVHSTKNYVPLNIHQSPFNLGVSIELPELSLAQVSTLADCYGLVWTTDQLEQLMMLVGGHPHLIQLALYHIAQNTVSLDQLLDLDLTESSPFYPDLQQHFAVIEQNPNLIPVLRSILMNEPVNTNSSEVLQLYRTGLVRLQQGKVELRCKLYRNWLSYVAKINHW